MTSAPFDAHAGSYDAVADSALGRVLRDRVHQVLNTVTAPGDDVVDIGCGTGVDAAWLAPQVRSVQAFDASANMVDLARARCEQFENVTVAQRDASALRLAEPVDVVVANFGVVNCVGELADFGARLYQSLVPGGYAVLVTMTRYCPTELAIGAATANRGLLGRRRPNRSHGGYDGLQVRYASSSDLANAFGDRFVLTRSESLGLVLPPFEQRSWVEDRPGLRRILAAADKSLGRLGAKARVGDHHIAVFRRAS